MKKILILYLLFSIICFNMASICHAKDTTMILTVEQTDPFNFTGEVDKRIFKKYIPVRIILSNPNEEELILSNKAYYIIKNKEYRFPSSALIFEKTKRHTIRRAILSTVLTLFIFTPVVVSGSIVHSVTTNQNLEENILKQNYRMRTLFPDDTYSCFLFVPKKHKKFNAIVIKGVNYAGKESFDLIFWIKKGKNSV